MSQRRLPVYILLDTSGSMRGEPVQAVNVGMKAMFSALRRDPYALESVHISVITFDLEARELFPLTPLPDIQFPEIVVPDSGPTFLGAALHLLVDRVERDVIRTTTDKKGDWRPLLFLMTDGSPSDMADFKTGVARTKLLQFANIIACAAGPKAKPQLLKELTPHVVGLDTMDSAAFQSFFKWVSASVASGSTSAGTAASATLPPPPPEVQIVL